MRQPVKWFADHMEATLLRNDDKGGWEKCPDEYLIMRLEEEVTELISAVRGKSARNPKLRILNEAADVANFAMMLADNAQRRIHSEEAIECI